MRLALGRPAVDGDLVKAALLARHHLDVLVRLQGVPGAGRNALGSIELTLLQGGHHGVGVLEESEDHLVVGRLLAFPSPVAGI